MDHYLADAVKSQIDDLPTDLIAEVAAYAIAVLRHRAEEYSAVAASRALAATIDVALAEEPGIPDPDDDGRGEIEHVIDGLRGRD